MAHKIYKVTSVKLNRDYVLLVGFDDGSQQEIDLSPILEGELYGPLKDIDLFRKVSIDPEIHTLIWPNGADFDPATLHDWPVYGPKFISLAKQWARSHRECNQPINQPNS